MAERTNRTVTQGCICPDQFTRLGQCPVHSAFARRVDPVLPTSPSAGAWQRRAEAAERRVAELETALEEVAYHEPRSAVCDVHCVEKMVAVARVALKGKDANAS